MHTPSVSVPKIVDVNLNQVIEFFDPIKFKSALSKKKSTGKIKDKGST
jgi:hypothetical protein